MSEIEVQAAEKDAAEYRLRMLRRLAKDSSGEWAGALQEYRKLISIADKKRLEFEKQQL